MSTDMSQVRAWYERAQIDYIHHYMSLYASFNAWYGTSGTNDRRAIIMLRGETALWDEYCRGESMRQLTLYMRQLVEYTQREPLSYSSRYWRGVVHNTKDWASLLEYWYRVRCLVMHGAEVRAQYVYLAYQTLNIFMGEIIRRQQH